MANEDILESEELQERLSQTYIGGILIDVLSEEKYHLSFESSTHPIQNGSRATDHINDSDESLTLTCMQGSDEDGKTYLEKYDELVRMAKAKELIDVVTSKQFHDTMVIIDYSDVRSAKRSGALFFTMELRKQKIVSTNLQKIDPKLIPKEQKRENKKKKPNPDDQTSEKENKGKLDKKPVRSDLVNLIYSMYGS